MSLSLIQGYSSPEEDEDEQTYLSSSSDDEEGEHRNGVVSGDRNNLKRPLFDPPNPSDASSSLLPSALDVFSQISGPPQFLNNSAGESASAEKDNDGQPWRHGRRRNRRDKDDMPAGAVMQAKAQLVGIRDRVSSDTGSNAANAPSTQSKVSSNATGGTAKRVATATNPNAENAADLLRMCVQCGIPKAFSNARGMVCPVCGDRPIKETDESTKKKGSMVKDKEKNKRMKGEHRVKPGPDRDRFSPKPRTEDRTEYVWSSPVLRSGPRSVVPASSSMDSNQTIEEITVANESNRTGEDIIVATEFDVTVQ
uniref:Uncharacterized protein n=1 Tax=Tanacetum cinerariifolium TaxID=118510 RepID=A0A6L2M0J6_TANCI|nr:hypothetical protein [Tanacetum cinerariifolium]